jgi:hypothetical protein
MTRILLQTTIGPVEDDWNIGRFSRLTAFLSGLPGVEVTARDRAAPAGETDPVLGSLTTAISISSGYSPSMSATG